MYKGEVHLCFYQGTQMIGWGHGHGIIMDKHYRTVKSVEPGSYQASSDMHEFKLINNGKSALMSQYLRSVYDLCPWKLCDGLGYIQQGAFQEVDVETGKVLFEWRSLDHVDPLESYVLPSTTEISGSGERPESPWDYFHINSIDKNQNRDYLVSARHVSAVYKVSGIDGHVIWRLNGAKSDFKLDGFSFSFQHDARFVSENDTHTVISLFDNGSNGFDQTQSHSTGQIISLDLKTKIASIILNLDPPFVDGHAHISKSQGNFQRLKNGNIIMGWGNDAFWTEYSPEYEIIFYGALGWSNVMNYRVHKFDNWIGLPLTKPALWAYSKNGTEMTLYTSWNGATEVKTWRFFGANDKKQGPWKQLGQEAKNGFETTLGRVPAHQYCYAEALDKDGHVLGTSEVEATFIPNELMREYCDDVSCRFMPSQEQRVLEQEEKARLLAEIALLRAEKEAQEATQRAQKEQEERERLEKELQLVTGREKRRERNAKIYGGTFGGLAGLVILVAILATDNFISRPAHRVIRHLWGRAGLNFAPGNPSEARLGRGYKALSLGDRDSESMAPMITDGS